MPNNKSKIPRPTVDFVFSLAIEAAIKPEITEKITLLINPKIKIVESGGNGVFLFTACSNSV